MSFQTSHFAKLALGTLAAVWVLGASAATVNYTNGILTVETENAGSSAGMFWVRTGASHPKPNQNVLYHTETSYITLRDVTASQIWTNGSSATTNIAPFTWHSMQTAPAAAAVVNLANGFRTTYTLPNWTVVQDVVVTGTSLADTNVRQTVTVTNTSGVARSYGVRYMWDWEIAGNDASVFRTRNPDSAFSNTFVGFTAPVFQAFEEQDSLTTPTFSVYGTVSGGSLVPTPTTPDRFGYVSWSDFTDAPWDLAIAGSNDDSATVHYWGFTTPLSLAPAASAAFTEYISTVQSAVGIGPTPLTGPIDVPTLSEWMIALLATLIAASTFYLRRRMH
jgi:hypothetical protein